MRGLGLPTVKKFQGKLNSVIFLSTHLKEKLLSNITVVILKNSNIYQETGSAAVYGLIYFCYFR